jgi:hypothetical protein
VKKHLNVLPVIKNHKEFHLTYFVKKTITSPRTVDNRQLIMRKVKLYRYRPGQALGVSGG